MWSARRKGLVLTVGLLVTLMPTVRLFAQAGRISVVQLTLTTGIVLICEDRGDYSGQLKVFNIKLGEEQTYPKHKTFARVGPDDPLTRASGAPVDARKPEALEIRRIVTMNSSQLRRLGAFPENLAAYASWLTIRGKPTGKGLRLALLPLQDTAGRVTRETTQRTEELTGELVRRGVSMVERQQFEKVVGEVLLNNTKLFDPDQAVRLGKQCGAGAVLLGTLTPKRNKADLNMRLVDTETGQILDAFSISDIEGLPDQRPAMVTATLAGTWDVTITKNGHRLVATMRPNGSAEEGNSKGKWTQDGLEFQVHLSRPTKNPRSPERFQWTGELTPNGGTFTAKNSFGDTLIGIKR